MTYALVAVQYPTQNPSMTEDDNWLKFLNASENGLKKAQSSEILAQNLWLLNLETDMPVLSLLVAQAERHGFPCRTLFLDQKPVFCLS